MDDRVGEVLAQRATLSGGATVGIAVSLLFHGALSGLAIWAALHHAEALTARTIEIRLAPVARATEAPPAPVVKAKEPVAKMEKPAPPVVVETKKPPAPPEKNTVPLSPFGKSTKKGSENAAPSVATPPPAPAVGVPVGGAGVVGLEGGDFPYTIYIDRMKTLIGSRWFRPQVGAGPTTTVHFVIERDGTLRDARIETESGNPTFDRAALRAVLESSPLPPLPFGYTGNYLGVHLSFR